MTDREGLLADVGWSDEWAQRFAEVVGDTGASPSARPGRIARHDGVAVMVVTPEGTVQLPVRGSSDVPTVGDWVVVDDAAVAAVLPRRTVIRRRDADKDVEQVLAANVDVVAAVCGLDRPVKLGRVQRTAMLAWEAGVTPIVVLTKADLVDDPGREADRVRAAIPGIDVHVVDARSGDGLDAVRPAIGGGTVVLVGESGAGKSTLTNALAGEERAATGEVRRSDAKGRHTTTSREMHPLGGGAVVIDSPGIRSVGVWVDAETLATTFPEIDELATDCRFADCAHDTEPGCAVRTAVEAGELSPVRLDAWREMHDEVVEAERRAELGGRRSRRG